MRRHAHVRALRHLASRSPAHTPAFAHVHLHTLNSATARTLTMWRSLSYIRGYGYARTHIRRRAQKPSRTRACARPSQTPRSRAC
eukprot:1842409-Pleurochrysis_carterae.AAC.1